MSENNKSNFNAEDFKNLKELMKKGYEESKKEYDKKKENGKGIPKQPLWQKVLGIILVIVVLICVVLAVFKNIGIMFAPKNSVTLIVSDQNGEVINGLSLIVESNNHLFTIDFDETSGTNITELGVKAGEYTITFENIPENYTCSTVIDDFSMTDGDKINLKYECTKE